MRSCDTNILEKREELSHQARRVIRIVTSAMNVLPVGTFKYNVFKYPGDIDIFEDLDACCSFNDARLSAAKRIQSIIEKILADGTIMFVEFKAGYDLRYKIYTGVVNTHIEDYNPELIRRDITNLFEAGLLTTRDYETLWHLVKEVPTMDDIIDLNETLRNFWVVRWNADEIACGYKILPGNYKLYLDIAVAQGSIVKLDTIAYVDGRYVEVTNFFMISALDKFGNRMILSEELDEYGQSLLLDVYKYYGTNPLKSIKRLWMYLAFRGYLCELSVFTPLFSSNIALYSQILSDIETAIALLSPTPLYKGVYDRKLLFDSLNTRLRLLNGLCITNPIYDDNETVVRNLSELADCLRKEINAATYEWLRANNVDVSALAQL